MKFKRILAAVLSVLMLGTMFVFTASAEATFKAVVVAGENPVVGMTAEGTVRSNGYDADNEIAYFRYMPNPNKDDAMHLGWHGLNAKLTLSFATAHSVGVVMRTSESVTPHLRFRNTAGETKTYTDEVAGSKATTGDGSTWDVIWFDFAANEALTYLTHMQLFGMGKSGSTRSSKWIEAGKSDAFFDVAGYVIMEGTVADNSSVNLMTELDMSGNVTLTLDAQNGTEATTQDVVSGTFKASKVTLPTPETVPSGKVFAGWATDANAAEGVTEIDAPTADTTYYAIWAQDASQPGDVTIAGLTLNGTKAAIYGLTDLTTETLTLTVPHNWKGDLVPALAATTTDGTASVEVSAGTYATGSTITVKNGSSTATYNVVYVNAEAGSVVATPSAVVTSNKSGGTYNIDGVDYTVTGTQFTYPATSTANQEIAGDTGAKIVYDTETSVSFTTKDDEAKTVKHVYIHSITQAGAPGFEGGGAFGKVTLSNYPWARVKYYIDPGKDGETYARPFVLATTSYTGTLANEGYAVTTKKNQAVASEDNMVAGRWAYAYINLAPVFAEDYGYTHQFHFRPYGSSGNFFQNKIMTPSEADPSKAVALDNDYAVVMDDAFYLGNAEIFTQFPEADGLYAQIAPYAGLFTVVDETEADANDGKINGLEAGMEYRLKGAEEWTAYTEPSTEVEAGLSAEVTGLAPGTYEIRYAAIAAAEGETGWSASPATEVTIKSALSAKPDVTAVNATAVGVNNGKVTGVDDAMSYRAVGAEEWTKVPEGTTEVINLAPGKYEFVYLADGETRTEDSEITTVTVLVDFDTDVVFYVTNNTANTDATVYDGSTYDKAYYINHGGLVAGVLSKYLEQGKTATMVVVDGIDLGGWKESIGVGNGANLVITGLTPESYINFPCCNAANTNFAMQNFGSLASLKIDNITIKNVCGKGEDSVKGAHGIVLSGMTNLTIGDGVVAGANSTRVRIYINADNLSNMFVIRGGSWEGIFAGPTYDTDKVVTGEHIVMLDGGSVHAIQGTRHNSALVANHYVYVNGGTVREQIIPGSKDGAFAGDSYVDINGGTVNKVYTTATATRAEFNNTGANRKEYTDSGIKNGLSVVRVNGGTVNAFANGEPAPGGSALIVSEGATVPALTGTEADYVITVADGGNVDVFSSSSEYSYQPIVTIGETTTNNGDPITYSASTIEGFYVTIPENYNTVFVNGEVAELDENGVLALDELSKDAVNNITFGAMWTLKGDLNGGGYGDEDTDGYLEDFFENGFKLSSDDAIVPNGDDLLKPYRSGYTLAGWGLTADATPEEAVEFPYTMTGDTTFYAIWVEANDTIVTADEEALTGKNYYVYNTEAEDAYAGFTPSMRADLGEFEYYGAYSVKVMNATTGIEDTEAHFSVEVDISDVDLDGKLLYIENAATGGRLELEYTEEGKCVIADVASGVILQVYTLDPIAMYELEGTYYAKRGEFVVDVYLDSPAVNAGSIGLGFACMTYVEAAPADGVQFLEITGAEAANDEGILLITWGVEDLTASIGGDGRVHIATLNFTMTAEEREWYLMLSKSIGAAGMEKTEEIYDGEYYLVAEHKANDLVVDYTPAVIADVTDTIGPDDMVTVKGTVVMSARENGVAPLAGNYATLYWRHKGAASWNSVVIESKATNTSVVEYTLSDVPADTEIEIYVEKNGYLTGKLTTKFEAKTDEETDEKPERTAAAITLVPGDIKGNIADACGDGKINIADFVRVLRGFDEYATDGYRDLVDINEDTFVNVTDLNFIKVNFGETAE